MLSHLGDESRVAGRSELMLSGGPPFMGIMANREACFPFPKDLWGKNVCPESCSQTPRYGDLGINCYMHKVGIEGSGVCINTGKNGENSIQFLRHYKGRHKLSFFATINFCGM